MCPDPDKIIFYTKNIVSILTDQYKYVFTHTDAVRRHRILICARVIYFFTFISIVFNNITYFYRCHLTVPGQKETKRDH